MTIDVMALQRIVRIRLAEMNGLQTRLDFLMWELERWVGDEDE